MDYDLNELEKLGAEGEKLRNRLAQIRPKIREHVLAAHAAGVRQVDIVKASRYTRDAIYKMTQDAVLKKVDEALEHPETFVEPSRPARAEGDEA